MASRVGASLGSEEPELLRVGWERRILLVRPTLGLGKQTKSLVNRAVTMVVCDVADLDSKSQRSGE